MTGYAKHVVLINGMPKAGKSWIIDQLLTFADRNGEYCSTPVQYLSHDVFRKREEYIAMIERTLRTMREGVLLVDCPFRWESLRAAVLDLATLYASGLAEVWLTTPRAVRDARYAAEGRPVPLRVAALEGEYERLVTAADQQRGYGAHDRTEVVWIGSATGAFYTLQRYILEKTYPSCSAGVRRHFGEANDPITAPSRAAS